MSKSVIPIILVSPELSHVFRILNPNAYANHIRADVMACADKMALVTHSVLLVQQAIERDLGNFLSDLTDESKYGYAFKGFVPDPQKPALAVYRSIGFQVGLQSFFITTKSMLDIYARVICKSIVPQSTIFGFNEGTWRGRKIVGGRLLNWIERSSPATYTKKEELISILDAHIHDWIAGAVECRDDIVHEGHVPGLIDMCVSLLNKPQDITRAEIILPAIKDKGNVLEYCQEIQMGINRFLKETIVLLPDVDVRLVALQ